MSTTTSCDLCGMEDYKVLYKPIGTKRNARVVVCKNCSLLYTITDDIPYSREPNPSCDADWGNVRFAKGQRIDSLREDLQPYVKGNVIDIGSSRGHFVKWAVLQPSVDEVTALEPDTRVVNYPLDYGVRLEDADLPKDHYDFVYCCQTLEHTDSATTILNKTWDIMKPGALLFLEVPYTIPILNFASNVEEYFIDKHNFHFTHATIGLYLMKTGFKIVNVREDPYNVSVLAEKTNKTEDEFEYAGNWQQVAVHVDTYAENIKRSRERVAKAVQKVSDILDAWDKVAFWGANVLMDLMVKHAGLDPKRVKFLADDYMAECITHLHGIQIKTSEDFRVFQPDVVIILARFNADVMAEKAKTFGIRNIVKFYDLL